MQILRGQSFSQQHFKWHLADSGLQRCRWVWQAATRTDKLQGVRVREQETTGTFPFLIEDQDLVFLIAVFRTSRGKSEGRERKDLLVIKKRILSSFLFNLLHY